MSEFNYDELEPLRFMDFIYIDREEYQNLVRQSEQIECLKRYIESTEYPSINGIKAIFNIKGDNDVK